MGTNTMVAAVGLVIGPVLGGALVAISWHWVFWFNVPFALLGSLWALLILRELAKPDRVRGYDIPGVTVFVVGLTGLVFGLSRGGLNGWSDPRTIGGIVAGVVLLPVFVLIERHHRAPMLDLTIFENRLFAAATGAAFINGLSRFALLFLFVFYFQGVKGQDPITAGHRARADGDRDADRLPARGRLRRPARLADALGRRDGAQRRRAGRDDDARRAHPVLLVGAVAVRGRRRLGHVQQPNTAAMMGTVPTYRRGIAAGARTMLQNTGAVISIAFVLAIVTSSVDKDTLFAIFSGVTTGLSDATLDPFVSNMHTALWVLAATSLVGGAICLLRPKGD